MSHGLLLQNGLVYDPLNGIDGEIMDISISGGSIAERVGEKARKIDLKGRVVMPGGVDLHSHIVGSKLGYGRAMCPEDHRGDAVLRTRATRGGVGSSMPTSYVTGYRYSIMGYTTVIEPALPAVQALSAWEELEDLPNLNSGMLTMLCNSMITLHYVKEGDLDGLAAYVAWILRSVGGLGVKAVNPGGTYAWAHGVEIHDIDQSIPSWEVTPREITRSLCTAVERLGLPHTLHLHPVNLGRVGNLRTTIAQLDSLKGIKGHGGRDSVVHLAHMSFECFDSVDENSTSWRDLSSGGLALAEYYNRHRHFTTDLGQITFGPATTITGDGPFEYYLHSLTKRKWTNATVDVENPGGSGVVPYRYDPKSLGNAVQWSIPLEFALSIDDTWRCVLSTDHPNAGPFTDYPLVLSWLMSKKQRDNWLKRLHPTALQRSTLPDNEREWTLFEVAISTRAAPSRILGIDATKGHLGIGADADIAVYDVNPNRVELSTRPEAITRAFRRSYLTVLGGLMVARKGRVVDDVRGTVLSTHPELSEPLWTRVNRELEDMMGKWFAHSFYNYPVPERYRGRLESKTLVDSTAMEP
jgi:formylmethanofuran dehydrogenase subunit A